MQCCCDWRKLIEHCLESIVVTSERQAAGFNRVAYTKIWINIHVLGNHTKFALLSEKLGLRFCLVIRLYASVIISWRIGYRF